MRTLYGVNPVREFLRSGAEGLSELWIAEGSKGRGDLERLARSANAKVRTAPRQKLDQLAGVATHQGVVAVVSDYRYRELQEILEAAKSSGRPPLVVVLDGIEDPQNLGAIIRS